MTINVEAEIRDLKRRISEIEGSFGFLMQQIRGVHKDLLAFQARTEQRFERVEGRFDRHDSRLDRIEKGVRALTKAISACRGVGAQRKSSVQPHTRSSTQSKCPTCGMR